MDLDNYDGYQTFTLSLQQTQVIATSSKVKTIVVFYQHNGNTVFFVLDAQSQTGSGVSCNSAEFVPAYYNNLISNVGNNSFTFTNYFSPTLTFHLWYFCD